MDRGIVVAILELVSKYHPLIVLRQDPSFPNIAVPNASYHHRQANLEMLTIFSIFSELLIRDQYDCLRVRSYSVASSVATFSSSYHYVDDILFI